MAAGFDPETTAENWAYVRRALRRYFILLMLPGLALLWGAGYSLGYFDGVQWARANSSASNETKESK